MNNTIALILAGGQGSRLGILSQKRAKPALIFGGSYRIIDFTLSNVINSGIQTVGILTQYKPLSLMDHIGKGETWGFIGRKRLCRILPPYTGIKDTDWYLGTADAVLQNLSFVQKYQGENIFVLSGDHIYNMDYRKMLDFHLQKEADLTIAVQKVPLQEAHRFGIAVTNKSDKIVEFQEKPPHPKNDLASLGIYIFSREKLFKRLREDANDPYSDHDFGKNIIPRMIDKDNVYAYKFDGYWKDVGTISSYWETHMELLEGREDFDLHKWKVRKNPYDRSVGEKFSSFFSKSSRVENSIIGIGCSIEGKIINSVLSPGVIVKKGAVIEDSIIMNDSYIGSDTHMKKCVTDKDITVASDARIGMGPNTPNSKYQNLLSDGITVIGKQAHIPADTTIGKNCLIFPDVTEECFEGNKKIASGSTIHSKVEHFWEK